MRIKGQWTSGYSQGRTEITMHNFEKPEAREIFLVPPSRVETMSERRKRLGSLGHSFKSSIPRSSLKRSRRAWRRMDGNPPGLHRICQRFGSKRHVLVYAKRQAKGSRLFGNRFEMDGTRIQRALDKRVAGRQLIADCWLNVPSRRWTSGPRMTESQGVASERSSFLTGTMRIRVCSKVLQ